MPQTILKRSIYIGLGGTGIKALRKTKKMYIDNYGEVPPMIQFMGIDTDQGEYEKKEKILSDLVYLAKGEQCSISVGGNPADYVNANRREMPWLKAPNDGMVRTLDRGAGQVRTNGRIAFIYNITNIKMALTTAYTNASSYQIVNNARYAPAQGNVEIHVIFSLGGGTGCGTFLDLAYLIRKMFGKNVNLYGYAVLPQVFREMMPTGPAMMRVKPNAYGALQDLDYLMHLGPNDEPLTLNWISDSYTEEDFARIQTPFDLVYLVDNINGKAVKYDKVENLADVISLALVAASGEIGTTNASVFDNVIQVMNEGSLNVNNKKAWVASVGTSDIVFKGNEVADTYAKKVIVRMIQRAFNSKEDGNRLATTWIDDIKIREDNGQDQVIDALCDKKPKQSLDITDQKEPKSEVDLYCDSIIKKATESAEKAKKDLEAKVPQSLAETVSGYLKSGDCFVTTTKDFISNVKSQIDIFIGEMEEEKVGFENKTDILKQKLDIAVKTLRDEANKGLISRSKRRIEEANEETLMAAANYVENEIEIIRRLYAVQFFNTILKELAKHQNSVDNIEGFLNNLKIQYTAALNKMTATGRSTTMEVDIAEDIIRALKVDDATLLFNDFYQFVGEGGLESVATTEEMEQIFYDYAKNRPEYSEWLGKTVSEVIDSLSEEEFLEVCRKAVEKAEPLLKVDGKGKKVPNGTTVDQAIAHSYFICVEDKDSNRFKKSKGFQESIQATQRIEYVSTGLKDRIIIYRQDYVVPGYAVFGVDDWRREYDQTKVSCHFDEIIHQRMIQENYSLEPSDVDEEVIGLWVKGFIFGLIKFDKDLGHGSYVYLNKKTGKAAKQYWVDTETYYRKDAYDKFCAQSREALEWFKEEIERIKNQMGSKQVEELVDIVTYHPNYQLHFSQYEHAGFVPASVESLKESKYNRVVEKAPKIKETRSQEPSIALFMQEMEYVDKLLAKEI